MLQITKQGNSIVVEGLNHYFYPYNGTLEVPCNSVITVVDEADIVLFRSASNYDVLFSAKIDEITINGQSVTKDNVGEVFGALSNVSSGGLTPEQEEKLNNAVKITDYNADKASQITIDEAQNTEINKLKGDIEGKQDIIQDLNAIREGADLGKTALQEETDPVWIAEKGNYYTKTEVDTSLETKANKSEIPTVPTNVSAFTNDAGYLTEHQSLDNYYTKTESDGKYATQVVVNEEIAARISDIREVKATLESKADKSEIPSLNGYATEQWVGEQGYLTEHQPLKTINGETIVGNGNINITQLEISHGISNYSGLRVITVYCSDRGIKLPSFNSFKFYKKDGTIVSKYLDYDKAFGGYKLYDEDFDDFIVYWAELTIDKGSSSFNYYINPSPFADMIQPKLTSGTDIKTINGESILGSGDIVISGGGEETDPVWTAEKVNYYTKTEVNTSLETKANKTEIPTVPTNVSAFTNDAGYLTQHQTLKTINGETIVGNGNIEISSGEETDPIWTAEKVNYYTKTEVNSSLESKADKTEIPSLNGYATEQWVGQQGYLTQHQSLDNYYTKSEIDGIVGNVNNALSEIING